MLHVLSNSQILDVMSHYFFLFLTLMYQS